MIDRRHFLATTGAALCAPTLMTAKAPTPTVLAHGGGQTDPSMLRELRKLAKGKRMLISPYSSKNPAATARSAKSFLARGGFNRADVLNLSNPAQARAQIAAADAIWFTGGFQKTQVLTLKGVPGVQQALLDANRAGTVMSGSSAGAAVMSKLMISGGSNGNVYTREGLGFLPSLVLDQHVRQRGREYRLQKVIASNRSLVGIGLDEATWATFSGSRFKVRGRGRAHVVAWSGGQVTTQKLRSGQSYDFASRAKD